MTGQDYFLNKIHIEATSFNDIPHLLKEDCSFILKAVEMNEKVLDYISLKLMDNEQFILDLIKLKLKYFSYSSERLKDNAELILNIARTQGDILEYASERIKDNDELVSKIIKTKGNAFKFASDRLKDSEDFLLKECEKKGYIIQYASERIQNNENIAQVAVRNSWRCFKKLPKQLQYNYKFLLAVYKENRLTGLLFPNEIRKEINRQNILDFLEMAALKNELETDLINNKNKNKKVKI